MHVAVRVAFEQRTLPRQLLLQDDVGAGGGLRTTDHEAFDLAQTRIGLARQHRELHAVDGGRGHHRQRLDIEGLAQSDTGRADRRALVLVAHGFPCGSTDRTGRPLVQAAIGLCLQSIDTHIAQEGVVDRAGGVCNVEVIDVDGQRAALSGHRAHECGDQLATALEGVLRGHLDGQDAVDAHRQHAVAGALRDLQLDVVPAACRGAGDRGRDQLVVAVLPAVELEPPVLADFDEMGDLRVGIAHAQQQRLGVGVLVRHHANGRSHDQAGLGGVEVLDVATARAFRQPQSIGGRATAIDAGGLR